MIEVHALGVEQVDACAVLFEEALGDLLRRLGLPARSPAPEVVADTASRVRHLRTTDPEGSWLALAGGQLVGFAQAARRDDCWILVHLFVRPGSQSAGVGRALLQRTTAYAADTSVGLIGATADGRAIRTYAQLPGFRTLPTVNASGTVRAARLDAAAVSPELVMVRDGDDTDVPATEGLDRRLRRGTRAPDIAYLLTRGRRLRVMPGRGYVVVGADTIDMLSAVDETSAQTLLADALVRFDGRPVTIGRMTGEQQWAFPLLAAAGLELRPWGPFVVRGLPGAPAPYLPSPTMC